MKNSIINKCFPLVIFPILTACHSNISQEKAPQKSENPPIQTNANISNAVPIKANDVENLITSLKNPNPNLVYVSLAKSELPPAEIQDLTQRSENLQKSGSLSGGKITHEFSQTDSFKKELIKQGTLEAIVKKLNFSPTDINAVLGDGFKLVGAGYSGAFNNGKYNSIFRTYQNSTNKRFEINEMYVPLNGDTTLVTYHELINFNLNGYPATFQKLKTADNQAIYDLDVNVKNRSFSVSSAGFSETEFLQTCAKIVSFAEQMP